MHDVRERTPILSSARVLIVVVTAYSFGNILYIILQTTKIIQRIGQLYVFVRVAENIGSNITYVGRMINTGYFHEGNNYSTGWMMGNQFSILCTGQKGFFPPALPKLRPTKFPNGLFPDDPSPGLKRWDLKFSTQLYLYPVLILRKYG